MALSVRKPARARSSTGASTILSRDEANSPAAKKLDQLSFDDDAPDEQDVKVMATSAKDLVHELQDQAAWRDVFRRGGGFERLVDTLLKLQPLLKGAELFSPAFDLLRDLLNLLGTVLRDHRGNRKYFSSKLHGWKSLQQSLQVAHQSLLGSTTSDRHRRSRQLESLYAGLLSLALDRPQQANVLDDLTDLSGTALIRHPQAAAIVLSLVLQQVGQAHGGSDDALQACADQALEIISDLTDSSARNKWALWQTDALSDLLKAFFVKDSTLTSSTSFGNLISALGEFGLNSLDDVELLLGRAKDSDSARELLLSILQRSKDPAFIQFDLSLTGHSSLELPCLPRTFPPSLGYSLSAWIRIDQFDPACHTTIFGAFDPGQHCFVLLYLEQDGHQLILQTSIRSSRPSVRFRSTRFIRGKWYHVTIVHKKTASDPSQSPAVLFVDGEFAEQVKIAYPEMPGEVMSRQTGNAAHSQRRSQPVQAFLGTPRDLTTSTEPYQIKTRWSLGSTHMLSTPISDEFVAVIHRLGPRYSGNFQDCLGPLLTYRASAELNRYNELLHPEKSEKSDIVIATEGRGAEVVAEAKLILSFSPSAIIDLESPRDRLSGSKLELDTKAYSKYQQLAQKTTAIALNGAVPLATEAISRSYGTALLIGEPVVVVPNALDDGHWRLAGALPLLARLLESAATKQAFLQAVQTFFDCVKDNWRISEAMERGNGFGILALLIREKLGFDTAWHHSATSRKPSQALSVEDQQGMQHELLQLILEFVGYNSDSPEDAMIVNPMAYRVLLLDFDTWRMCDLPTQKLYYLQFIHFVSRNKHHAFNAKRLARMRIVKKLIDAMKAERIETDAVDAIAKALKVMLGDNPTHHLYRDLAMFVAYALQDERAAASHIKSLASAVSFRTRAVSWAKSARGSRPNTPGGPQPQKPLGVPKSTLAIEVLNLLVDGICTDRTTGPIRRFHRAVPPRWMLHLMSESDARVVGLTLRLLCQALRCLGSEFRKPFVENSGGFSILKARLKLFWKHPQIWVIAFATLFARGLLTEVFQSDITLHRLVDIFQPDDSMTIANPEMFPVIMGMLETGLRSVTGDETPEQAQTKLLKTMIQFLNELFNRSCSFREFAVTSRYVQDLLFVLYPVIVGSDRLSADLELQSEKDTLNFKGAEVKLRPHSNSLGDRPSSIRSVASDTDKRPRSPMKVQAPKKLSSFELMNDTASDTKSSPAQFSSPITPKKAEPIQLNIGNALIESLLEVGINVFLDQICNNNKYSGLGLFQKVPPGFQEHQAYFESYILVRTLLALWSHLQLNPSLLTETKLLMNLAKFSQHIAEAVFEGWFVDGAQALLRFCGNLLDYMQQPDISNLKNVRLCSQAINDVRIVFLRVILLRLSELDETINEGHVVKFLQRMNYWQTILFSSDNQETQFIRLMCYLLYTKLGSESKPVRTAAAQLWRTLLVQKSSETATLLSFALGPDHKHLLTGFMKLVSLDDDDFIAWFDENRLILDRVFVDALSKSWDAHVEGENRRNEESARVRLNKRREKLRQWQTEEADAEEYLHRYETSTKHWRSNAHSQERLKLQRALQDQQENVAHLLTVFAKIDANIQQPCGLEPPKGPNRWQLDETEAVNRMRMRTLPDTSVHREAVYQPKRKVSERTISGGLTLNTSIPRIITDDGSTFPSPLTAGDASGLPEIQENKRGRSDSASNSQLLEGSFEMIDDPREDEEGVVEDKNRKVMTSLQRGDQVQQLYNISRIVGLEACEGLLVVGKKCLYLQDNFFQRSDGEIVSVSQATPDERDPYVQLISGQDIGSQRTKHSLGQHETRNWAWTEVLSVSKRRFLFRDVSIEVFFTDGRSYLMTLMSTKLRDDVYNAIVNRAPHVHSTSTVATEDAWRLDTLRNPEEVPQSLGFKLSNVFSAAPTHTATRKWIRGDMSNFQYLMLVNTMAGRTFNDLTQYPVFPWIIADYTSEELDLSDPKSYRDLSKPMGCQNSAREAEYRERFKQFAEMGDTHAPPFHYGTHYSTAMIVSSYLIRLQPFVQSYLLLQGGSFDHADRLFDSIGKAWSSCSKDNMTDVRELIPEFFYLPEFLTNTNAYDFGEKQGEGGIVNDVQLPPWAKGDPHVFISKQREALESPYVSENLHKWIDLVFGYKQRGDPAVDATNVFQHLSYQGAKDLDTIDDPVERLATIGIIHSFGQTPHQVFQRPHPARELEKFTTGRLDSVVSSLIKLPSPVFESDERIADLTFSRTQERLLCSGACKVNMPPHCDRYMQWGFADDSLRFFSSNSKRPMGLYENTHIGPISAAVFADSKTLVTAGDDCTVSIWAVNAHKESIDIQPKTCLFGHRTAITHLAASRVFSTLLSISADGQAISWDLNRHDCVRVLFPAGGPPVQCAKINNTNGHILICRGGEVLLYTLNGRLLVQQRVSNDDISCCAFYEGTGGGEWLTRELIFTGHAHGIANVWTVLTTTTTTTTSATDGAGGGANWQLQLVKRLNHADAGREDGANIAASITAVLPMPQAVYTGDEDGKVWEWDPVQRSASSDTRKR